MKTSNHNDNGGSVQPNQMQLNFEDVYREYSSRLVLFAFSLLKDEYSAEDIVQNCFVKLWEQQIIFYQNRNIKSYLFAVVKNACINQLARQKNDDLVFAHDEYETTIEQAIIKAEIVAELHQRISSLPVRMQEVVRLHYLEGNSQNQVAEILQTDPGTVRTQKGRALQLLRNLLSGLTFLFALLLQ